MISLRRYLGKRKQESYCRLKLMQQTIRKVKKKIACTGGLAVLVGADQYSYMSIR